MKFFHQNSCLIDSKTIESTARTLKPYLEHLQRVAKEKKYEAAECSINLSTDENILKLVQKTAKKFQNPKLKYLIVIGIGGSNLGAKAVYDALYGYKDLLQPERFPKLIFLDTNDREFLGALEKFLRESIKNPDEILINVITKSGTTTETIVNFERTIHTLEQRFPLNKILERCVIITDERSKLWHKAKEKGLTILTMPAIVGGRFSIFSAAGLFPLAVAGVDVKAFCKGAGAIKKLCLTNAPTGNIAVISASLLFLHMQKGKNINDNFFFHPELESLGKWYRQLMGESIGKGKDLQGRAVKVGITPTVSVGSTDLHSMAQLYLGGPLDKYTTFVFSDEKNKNTSEKLKGNFGDDENFFSDLISHLENKSAGDIMRAIFEGVKRAYLHSKLPFNEIILKDISANSLGEFMQFKMLEMMFLGKLLNVNTFDQPNVEIYKIETKKILARS